MNPLEWLKMKMDPYTLLGIDRSAKPAEIRIAYFNARKKHLNTEETRLLEQAFLLLKDESLRRQWDLLSPLAKTPEEVIESLQPQPAYIGPGPWLRWLRSKEC